MRNIIKRTLISAVLVIGAIVAIGSSYFQLRTNDDNSFKGEYVSSRANEYQSISPIRKASKDDTSSKDEISEEEAKIIIQLRKIHTAILAVSNLYVDTVKQEKIVEDAIRGMLEKLDPHSTYLTAKEVKSSNETLQGNFDGIGIQFNMIDDTLLVIQTIDGGPSERAGLMPGDRIVAVNDTAIAGVNMPKENIMQRLRGPKGTQVNLSVVRNGIKGTLEFVITRDKIPVKTVNAVFMIRPKIGYIRIASFGQTTYEEVLEGLKRLSEEGMEGLILDMQGNGGGYLIAAVSIANEFLDEGDMIVYTEGKSTKRYEYKAKGNGLYKSLKLAVLVDSYSASASEIVSGAIQDQDRGIVVGRRTFGKGLVQRPIDLPDGSMIRLTVSHYYTPSGRCIQKPYDNGGVKDYAKDLENRLKSGELTNVDSVKFIDSLKYYTLKKHRIVYGGGGIMPDFYVPLDTNRYTKYHMELSAKSVILNTSLHYVDNHRKELTENYASFKEFRDKYEVPQSLIDTIFAQAKEKDIKPRDSDEVVRTLPELRLQLKALVARDLWDIAEYYAIINENSEIVLKAIEVLEDTLENKTLFVEQ